MTGNWPNFPLPDFAKMPPPRFIIRRKKRNVANEMGVESFSDFSNMRYHNLQFFLFNPQIDVASMTIFSNKIEHERIVILTKSLFVCVWGGGGR